MQDVVAQLMAIAGANGSGDPRVAKAQESFDGMNESFKSGSKAAAAAGGNSGGLDPKCARDESLK